MKTDTDQLGSVGLHLGDRTASAVEVRREGQRLTLWRIGQAPLEQDPGSETLVTGETQAHVAESLRRLFGDSGIDRSSVTVSLGGNLAVIKRVPLEVASESERREQVVWEAGQHLLDSISDYEIDYHTFGRVAFLVAIRRKISDACRLICERADIGVRGFEVDPLSLFYTCLMVSEGSRVEAPGDPSSAAKGRPEASGPALETDPGRVGARDLASPVAVHLGGRWASCISLSGFDLAAVEVVRLDRFGWRLRSGGEEYGEDTTEAAIRRLGRRIADGLVLERRHRAAEGARRVLLSGDRLAVEEAGRWWKGADHLAVEFIDSFACAELGSVPPDQRPLLDWPTGFSLSAGAAYRGLCG